MRRKHLGLLGIVFVCLASRLQLIGLFGDIGLAPDGYRQLQWVEQLQSDGILQPIYYPFTLLLWLVHFVTPEGWSLAVSGRVVLAGLSCIGFGTTYWILGRSGSALVAFLLTAIWMVQPYNIRSDFSLLSGSVVLCLNVLAIRALLEKRVGLATFWATAAFMTRYEAAALFLLIVLFSGERGQGSSRLRAIWDRVKLPVLGFSIAMFSHMLVSYHALGSLSGFLSFSEPTGVDPLGWEGLAFFLSFAWSGIPWPVTVLALFGLWGMREVETRRTVLFGLGISSVFTLTFALIIARKWLSLDVRFFGTQHVGLLIVAAVGTKILVSHAVAWADKLRLWAVWRNVAVALSLAAAATVFGVSFERAGQDVTRVANLAGGVIEVARSIPGGAPGKVLSLRVPRSTNRIFRYHLERRGVAVAVRPFGTYQPTQEVDEAYLEDHDFVVLSRKLARPQGTRFERLLGGKEDGDRYQLVSTLSHGGDMWYLFSLSEWLSSEMRVPVVR